MIAASSNFSRLVDALVGKAETLARAAATRRNDPLRWRKAALLWPLFTKD